MNNRKLGICFCDCRPSRQFKRVGELTTTNFDENDTGENTKIKPQKTNSFEGLNNTLTTVNLNETGYNANYTLFDFVSQPSTTPSAITMISPGATTITTNKTYGQNNNNTIVHGNQNITNSLDRCETPQIVKKVLSSKLPVAGVVNFMQPQRLQPNSTKKIVHSTALFSATKNSHPINGDGDGGDDDGRQWDKENDKKIKITEGGIKDDVVIPKMNNNHNGTMMMNNTRSNFVSDSKNSESSNNKNHNRTRKNSDDSNNNKDGGVKEDGINNNRMKKDTPKREKFIILSSSSSSSLLEPLLSLSSISKTKLMEPNSLKMKHNVTNKNIRFINEIEDVMSSSLGNNFHHHDYDGQDSTTYNSGVELNRLGYGM